MQLVLWISRLAPFQQLLPQLNLEERPDLSGTAEGLWIEPAQLLELINAWPLAQWAVAVTYWLHPALRPSTGPGRPYTYPDAVVLLTVIVMRIWRKGYESFTAMKNRRFFAQSLLRIGHPFAGSSVGGVTVNEDVSLGYTTQVCVCLWSAKP